MTHNILYYNSIDGGLKQFSNTDVAQLSEYVLELMAASTYAGTITIGVANPIGTFTDTVRQGGVGSSDITILSNTYTLSQVNTVQSTVDPPMYLGVVQAGSNVIIQENATTLNDLADEIIQSLISDYGVNSYYLGLSPPGDGGTWVSRGALLDTLENFTVTNSDYRLWHKTTSASYTSYKAPLKLNASLESQEWSSTEVQNLIKKVEERIVATSIGTYALQSTVPATGTWVSVGTIQDVRRDIVTDPAYTGLGPSYTATYQGDVPTVYTGPGSTYTATYQGDVPTAYTGPGPIYTATYLGDVPTAYTGPGPIYTATYDGIVSTNYTLTQSFQGIFNGPTYLGPVNYTGQLNYTGDFTSTYSGPATYTADPVFNSAPANFTVTYLGDQISAGFNIYYGPTPNIVYQSIQPSPSGPVVVGYTSTIDSSQYLSPAGLYTRENILVFNNTVTKSLPYTGQTLFTNPDASSFTRIFQSTFSAAAVFTNVNASSFLTSYTGPVFSGDVAVYTGDVPTGFNGTLFQGTTNFTGLVPTDFEGSSFQGTTNFTGLVPTDFDGTSFQATTNFTGLVPTDFDGTSFQATANYTGPSLVVSNTSIISSVTLWKRVL